MIKPLANHVLICPIETESKTKGGVVLPDTVEKSDQKKAKVVAVGKITDKQGKIIKPEIKVGDSVIYDSFANEFEEKDKKYMVIKYSDILAIIK